MKREHWAKLYWTRCSVVVAIFGNTEVHFSSHLHGESFTFNQSAAETILMTFVLLN